ncbi:MAG: transketolase C-terminal domain-containing protein, partial [Betaproteobacteria bacterium]
NLDVWRPCDTVETFVSWTSSLERRDGPSCLLATRQGVPHQTRTQEQINAISKGAYVLSDAVKPQAIILATGSEVALAMRAKEALGEKGVAVRVVSAPSTTVFDRQPEEYKNSVLLNGIPRVAVEAGVTDFWRKYVGTEGAVIGIDRFGESAPADELYEYFGITAGAVEEAVLALVSK